MVCVFSDDATLLEYRYCMKLILDDGTASIDVIVDGEHGVGY